MKKLSIGLCVLSLFIGMSSKASPQPGAWKLSDAYCSNPDFKFNEDEQAFVDAIRHSGDYPWTDDVFTVTGADSGEWQSTFFYGPGLACEVTQSVKISYPSADKIRLVFTNARSKAITPDPKNIKISCESKDDAVEEYFLKQGQNEFDLFWPNQDCGEYHLKFKRQ